MVPRGALVGFWYRGTCRPLDAHVIEQKQCGVVTLHRHHQKRSLWSFSTANAREPLRCPPPPSTPIPTLPPTPTPRECLLARNRWCNHKRRPCLSHRCAVSSNTPHRTSTGLPRCRCQPHTTNNSTTHTLGVSTRQAQAFRRCTCRRHRSRRGDRRLLWRQLIRECIIMAGAGFRQSSSNGRHDPLPVPLSITIEFR